MANIAYMGDKWAAVVRDIKNDIDKSPPGVIWVESDSVSAEEGQQEENGLRRVVYGDGSPAERYWYAKLRKLMVLEAL